MQIQRSNRGGTVINALSFLCIFVLCLSTWLLLPITVKRMHLDELMGEATLQRGVGEDEELIQAFIEEAERKRDIIIFEEDVYVEHLNKTMTLHVTWRPIVRLPLIGKEFELEKKLSKQRIRL